MKYNSKRARWFYHEAMEYHGLYRVRKYKKLARRKERHENKQNLAKETD